MQMMQKEREAENFQKWESQEDTFHLEQAKLRSRIRIKDGRAKPIDLLAKYALSTEEGAEDFTDLHEPYTYLNGLTAKDLENLLEDIQVYEQLEQGKNQDFWRDMTIITKYELQNLSPSSDRRAGINEQAQPIVINLFKGKTYKEMVKVRSAIEAKLKQTSDVSYWEQVLKMSGCFMAKARRREKHQEHLKMKLDRLKQEDMMENNEEDDDEPSTSEMPPPIKIPLPNKPQTAETPSTSCDVNQDADDVISDEMASMRLFDELGYEPALLKEVELPLGVVVVGEKEDKQTIRGKRKLLNKTGSTGHGQEEAFVKRAREGMDRDEAEFSVQAEVSSQVILWADKYRPRKPRFFNRVHTGFEWNKYNQTHYDFDNPPPKIVQGYKFNIFYPDLIDPTKTPQHYITDDPTNPDFSVLRFSAGAPYEDIAFKIVKKEWEQSHKHGFRCQFINSIFQLWFHFKRYRYRR